MSKRVSVSERLNKEIKKQDPVDELIKSTAKEDVAISKEDLWELKRQTYYIPKILIDALGFKKLMEDKNISEIVRDALEENINKLDILYMTRVQKERFFNEEDYVRLKDSYILDKEKMENAKEDMIIMHPLPRVNEIAYEIDEDPRACYFKQAKLGMYVRMALMTKLLGAN